MLKKSADASGMRKRRRVSFIVVARFSFDYSFMTDLQNKKQIQRDLVFMRLEG